MHHKLAPSGPSGPFSGLLIHKTKSDHFDLDNLGDDEFDVKIEGVSDPCTEAALFWGDQALSEDDVQDCLSFSRFFSIELVLHNL